MYVQVHSICLDLEYTGIEYVGETRWNLMSNWIQVLLPVQDWSVLEFNMLPFLGHASPLSHALIEYNCLIRHNVTLLALLNQRKVGGE